MRKNSIPTLDRGTSLKTKAAVLDRHFPPRKKTAVESRRILPVSKLNARTASSDRLPDLLAEAPRKETEKPTPKVPITKVAEQNQAATSKVRSLPPAPPTPDKDTGLMPCPQPRADDAPLTRHSIPLTTCEERQAKGYHKCGTCSFATARQFKGVGLPPLENSPAHLQHARLLGLFGPDGEWLRR